MIEYWLDPMVCAGIGLGVLATLLYVNLLALRNSRRIQALSPTEATTEVSTLTCTASQLYRWLEDGGEARYIMRIESSPVTYQVIEVNRVYEASVF